MRCTCCWHRPAWSRQCLGNWRFLARQSAVFIKHAEVGFQQCICQPLKLYTLQIKCNEVDKCKCTQITTSNFSMMTRSSADADKPAWHPIIYIYIYIYITGSDDARPSYCVFSIFKMAAVRHLGFSYFRIFFYEKFKFAPISTSSCKICWRSDDARPSYCVFSIFKMVAFHHLWFSYFRIICE